MMATFAWGRRYDLVAMLGLLVMGRGGYRFSDYWRLGLPLSMIVVGVPLIAIFWPFQTR